VISVMAGRFVAAALLSLYKTFVAAASLSHRAKLPGGVRWAAWGNKWFLCVSVV